ncbi:MAG: magnesium transporter [Actinomycetota bacterium]
MNEFQELIEAADFGKALQVLTSARPADAADLLESLDDESLAVLVGLWDVESAAIVLAEISPEARPGLAERLPSARLADILDAMPPDEAADFLREIDSDQRERILQGMELDEATDVSELLDYPEDSAGRRMSQDFLSVGEESTVEHVIQQMREVSEDVELIYYVYVLGGSEQLKGVVSLRRLITAAPNARIGDLMETDVESVRPDADVEDVVDVVSRYNLLACPITDEFGRMLGIVTVDDVLETMEEEAGEDVLRFAGSLEDQTPGKAKVWPALRRRLPWLGAATLIELFIAYVLLRPLDPKLLIAVVAYIPLLIFMGGNTAVQAAARVLVQLESERTESWNPWSQARREVEAGVLLALLAGALTFPFLALLDKSWQLAAVVTPAVCLTVVFGAGLGSVLPVVLQRLRLDPATASGPLLGSIMDVVSLAVYIALATVFSAHIV